MIEVTVVVNENTWRNTRCQDYNGQFDFAVIILRSITLSQHAQWWYFQLFVMKCRIDDRFASHDTCD